MDDKLTNNGHLHGKWEGEGFSAEINTMIPWVAIETQGHEYFWQGEQALRVIHGINMLYNHYDVPVEEAIERWLVEK